MMHGTPEWENTILERCMQIHRVQENNQIMWENPRVAEIDKRNKNEPAGKMLGPNAAIAHNHVLNSCSSPFAMPIV